MIINKQRNISKAICLCLLVAGIVPACEPQPLQMKTDWQRLDELGITKNAFRALPVDKQIEILADVAAYAWTVPLEAGSWMALTIGQKGAEAITPVVVTIRAYLPPARNGDRIAKNMVYWLPDALLYASRDGINLRGTEAAVLIDDLACNPTNGNLSYAGHSVELLLVAIHPELAVPDSFDAKWQRAEICKSLGK